MRYSRWIVLSTLLLCLIGGPIRGQKIVEEPAVEPFPIDEQEPFNLWMDVKLKKSQDIFAAMTKADFERIIQDTKQLRTLNELEGFVRKSVPGYVTQLKAFQFAVDEIEKQAKQKNIEGVTLGFQQLTMSCVHCHNNLRSELPPAGKEP